MTKPVDLVEVWRGALRENVHQGHAIVCDGAGEIIESWGDPETLIYPRSSCKMVQALPLVESGAADRLSDQHLAIAASSHNAAAIHTDLVGRWLKDLGFDDDAFRCGPAMPMDKEARYALIRAFEQPCQIHNECSGKHAGFLTLSQYLNADADYELIDHPVQKALKAACEEVTGETSPFYGIDGCSAPNHACTLHGLGRAMSFFATAHDRNDTRSKAAARLTRAMAAHPEFVAGEGRTCTGLMRAMDHKVTIKTGADGLFVAIVPEKRISIALKVMDGTNSAQNCVIAALLVRLGLLDPKHPEAVLRLNPAIESRRGFVIGYMRPTSTLLDASYDLRSI
ncbi:asparaginase [Yoonia sp.]|uniref:asparaginase n=1 Tax=Yoonia sp. TaxID=2212373 RepID=UPI0035C7BD90